MSGSGTARRVRAERWSRADYEQDPETLARKLIGARLVRMLSGGERLSGVIVETEAYLGVEDRAAHSYGGHRTPRNESMYGPPGLAYVYFTYGMHHCVNVVCGREDEPVAVLIRALRPGEGLDVMRQRRSARGRSTPLRERDLCSGPGKLCQAMAIDRGLDGADLTNDQRLFIEPGPDDPQDCGRIVRTPRIGVEYAGDWARTPLRYRVSDLRFVSRK